MYLSVTTCILPAKRFFSRFRATSQEQENKEARHSGIASYKKKSTVVPSHTADGFHLLI